MNLPLIASSKRALDIKLQHISQHLASVEMLPGEGHPEAQGWSQNANLQIYSAHWPRLQFVLIHWPLGLSYFFQFSLFKISWCALFEIMDQPRLTWVISMKKWIPQTWWKLYQSSWPMGGLRMSESVGPRWERPRSSFSCRIIFSPRQIIPFRRIRISTHPTPLSYHYHIFPYIPYR